MRAVTSHGIRIFDRDVYSRDICTYEYICESGNNFVIIYTQQPNFFSIFFNLKIIIFRTQSIYYTFRGWQKRNKDLICAISFNPWNSALERAKSIRKSGANIVKVANKREQKKVEGVGGINSGTLIKLPWRVNFFLGGGPRLSRDQSNKRYFERG